VDYSIVLASAQVKNLSYISVLAHFMKATFLRCFDTVGSVTGRASCL